MFLKLFFIILILLNFKTLSSQNIQYDNYIKNYYDIPSYYDDCKDYFDNFESETLNNIVYKNKLDKIIEYVF